jgi:4-alpha-glucanotransferase
MVFSRASGILLHPTSLPGTYGIGDLGDAAFSFCEMLAGAGQTYWQVLPLGPTGYGDSPYQCFSAFAGNTLLVSPDKLVADRLLAEDDLNNRPEFGIDRVDYGAVFGWKNELLRRAYGAFLAIEDDDLTNEFNSFCAEHAYWLDDYSLYRAIKESDGQRAWYEWPETLRLRDPQTIESAVERLADGIRAEKFYQFIFFRQWGRVKEHANSLGIKIIGDLPIFVALDSADVWRHQDQFKLNADGSPQVVAGVPPDYFSSTGQRWGNPIYNWDAMADDGFRWWISRFRASLEMFDIVRIDHFRGFASAWEVPGGDKTAENGTWVEVPGRELFTAVREELGSMPIVAEDLGEITPDVEALLEEFHFPGMRILQFGFGGDAGNLHLPHNYIKNCAAYTGNHDNDTSNGWFASLGKPERNHCLQYLNSDGAEIHWDMIREVWASVADTAIAPMQDILGLGNDGRMNLPASVGGNWDWRLTSSTDDTGLADRLREMTAIYGRLPQA